ncbi:hypothetical protein [Oleiharenicola sp. Vm1]|uniref:hypothetical protein n=1 Tax=Oleiharenicola sp. Vm1 TaxID=3398393 RepID=UPI0039F4B49B
MIEATAAAELADGTVVTMALPKAPARPVARPVAAAEPTQAENSAAVSGEKNAADPAPENAFGKTF